MLKMHQLYLKITFLSNDLDEEVYIEQPKRFVIKGQENKISKLLYDLK